MSPRRGRPKLPPAEKRTIGVSNLFNEREQDRMQRAASKRNKKPATYVREAVKKQVDEDLGPE